MDRIVAAAQSASHIVFTVVAFVMLSNAAMYIFGVTADLLGYGGRVFLQHPSNLFEAAPLQKFLFNVESVGEREMFSGLSDSMSHCGSFPADR